MNDARSTMLPYQRARFSTQLPVDYLYSPAHWWIGRRDDQTWRAGLTKFGSRMFGEMVDYGFDLRPGTPVTPGQAVGWIEGFKALADVVCLVQGEFAGVNPALDQNITLINQDPFGAGWIYAVKGQPDSACLGVQAYVKVLD